MYQELQLLKKKVDFLEHQTLEEETLTAEEESQLENAREEHKQGKTISLENLKKELGDD